MEITLPIESFKPRGYQLPLLKALDTGYKRAVWVAHRRSGKDLTMMNYIAKKMYERVGAYYYVFPTYKQATKVIWDGMTRDGFKFTDYIPKELRKRTDNGAMLIETQNGSIFRLVGSDNIDSLMGANPVGVVFSEWSLQNPQAWDYIRPILAENGGWAVFIYTPRGKNHGHTLLEMARKYPDIWYTEVLDVEKTKAISPEVLNQEYDEIFRKDGNDALYQQEYMCSFEVPIQGAYYANQLMLADQEKRIATVPYDSATPVHTAWDLGIDDSTAIWFFQIARNELHLIDYYESSGEGVEYYIKYLQDKRYIYGRHFAPHDIAVRELGTGKSRLEVAKTLGIKFEVGKNLAISDGIQAVRNILGKCWFDKDKCERGLSALRSYHKEWDEDNQVFKNKPEHDWASHGCLVGDTSVLTDAGEKPISEIVVGDNVWTPLGYERVLNAGITKTVSYLLDIETNIGSIRCTPEHKFFTNRGVVCADALRYNDSIWTQEIDLSRLHSTELLTNFREGIMSLHLAHEKNIVTCTGLYGRFITGIFQKVSTYTTRTVIALTTALKTLSVYLNTTTYHKKQKEINGLVQKPIRSNSLISQFLSLKSGTDQKRVSGGTQNMEREHGKIENGRLSSALCVEKINQHRIPLEQNTVARVVKVNPVHCSKTPVYDLTVNKHHCYLANGMLVSNSDAFRTLAVGYREMVELPPATVTPIRDDPYQKPFTPQSAWIADFGQEGGIL